MSLNLSIKCIHFPHPHANEDGNDDYKGWSKCLNRNLISDKSMPLRIVLDTLHTVHSGIVSPKTSFYKP